ncbi:putative cytokinetic ring protein SteA [Sporosalibacterium faouarense]|uniref:putative cytokinetic ring protein SteA n=1 Tax=Sporosalibacterium faouarense TaxID=516123 RepID=UPI00141D242A|nr:putative cytokinetic ring protein SteA [Sporosalibacterium faouarense]MTI48182.1 hypothetical protein [Bacillota bacterium]
MSINGIVKKDRKTKNLIGRLRPGDIAVISHSDLDELAAIGLVESKVKCVINTDKTISGRYPNKGPSILLDAKIPIYEAGNDFFLEIKDNESIKIGNNTITSSKGKLYPCTILCCDTVTKLLDIGYKNTEKELDKFIENTLLYAKKEKDMVLGKLKIPKTKVDIKDKHVLVVVRGKDYKKDLTAIKMYINEMKPILIGVDGGGDALLEFGYTPDIVIGDMDSVSDKCLKIAKEIIVHAYSDGKAPGLTRIEKLGLNSTIFSSPGTSEDIAMLLAYSNGADLIVAVGSHSNMIDFLEKGRKGMASTFLVRLKVGSKLVDAKGVNKLYKNKIGIKYILGLGVAALIPILVIIFMFPPLREFFKLMEIRLRLFLGL